MVGPIRPQFVLFGSSIVQYSFSNGGWGAILADLYSRKVLRTLSFILNNHYSSSNLLISGLLCGKVGLGIVDDQ